MQGHATTNSHMWAPHLARAVHPRDHACREAVPLAKHIGPRETLQRGEHRQPVLAVVHNCLGRGDAHRRPIEQLEA